MAAAAVCQLTYNPLEGEHERGGARKRRSSMTALVEEDESCATLALPCVAPIAGPAATATSPGAASARSARSKSSLASLPDVSARLPSARSASSTASSPRWPRRTASGMLGAGSLASMGSFISTGSAATASTTFSDATRVQDHGANSSKSGEKQGGDHDANRAPNPRRRSKRSSKGRRSRTSTSSRAEAPTVDSHATAPNMVQVVTPTQFLVLSTRADGDGKCHWKSRWCLVLRGAMRMFRSKRSAVAAGTGHSRRPTSWLRLRDIRKVLRVADNTVLPGTTRSVKNCMEITAANTTLFVQAKTPNDIIDWGRELFTQRKLERVERGNASGKRLQWAEHRMETGAALFYRAETGECTAAVRDMATNAKGRVHSTHVLFEPPPASWRGDSGAAAAAANANGPNSPASGGAHFGDDASESDEDTNDCDDASTELGSSGEGVALASLAQPRPPPRRGSNKKGASSWSAVRADAAVPSPRTKPGTGRFRPARMPAGKFHIPEAAAARAHDVLAHDPVSPGLLAALTTPVGDHRGLHVDMDAQSVVSAHSFHSDGGAPTPSGASIRSFGSRMSLCSHTSRTSLVSGASSNGTGPGLGMLVLQLNGQCNGWAGSRRNVFSSSSPRGPGASHGSQSGPNRRLSSSTGSSRVSSSSNGSGGGSGGGSGAGGGSHKAATGPVWYELWDPETQWPYYVSADTHERQWEWPQEGGARVVHWSDCGSSKPAPPSTRNRASSKKGSRSSAAAAVAVGKVSSPLHAVVVTAST